MRIVFSSGLDEFVHRNSSFDSGVLRVAYTGKNRNNSFISKQTFEQCMDSIYNCPIVCNYDRETDSIGGHDMDLVPTECGGTRLVNLTQPVGVVPESARYWWEEIEDASGVHEYLCTDVLLWKRQEAYQKIRDDGITSESMEIKILDGSMENGIYVIHRFEFEAFCLLGSAKPCFESAALEVFSCSDFKQQLAEMMRELKESYALEQTAQSGAGQADPDTEGGERTLEEKMQLMEQFGLTQDMVPFDLALYELDELQTKFAELAQSLTAAEPETQQDYALAGAIQDGLLEALDAQTVQTEFGPMHRYWFEDYDSEAMEVYCWDTEDWRLYGFSYSMNGDNVVVDFESRKRKKYIIVDFDEGTGEEGQTPGFASAFALAEAQYRASNSDWESRFAEKADEVNAISGELETLRQFKHNAEEAAAQVQRNAILDQFSELEGSDDFTALVENSAQYTLEELEEKCYALRGRNAIVAKFSAEPKTTKLAVEHNVPVKEPYGGVFAEYGIGQN